MITKYYNDRLIEKHTNGNQEWENNLVLSVFQQVEPVMSRIDCDKYIWNVQMCFSSLQSIILYSYQSIKCRYVVTKIASFSVSDAVQHLHLQRSITKVWPREHSCLDTEDQRSMFPTFPGVQNYLYLEFISEF